VGIALMEAARLAKVNRARLEELEDRHAALPARVDRERAATERRRQEIYDGVLVPFRDIFARLKNVDLAELAAIDVPDGGQLPAVQVDRVRLTALHAVGALAGGVTAGAGAGATAFATVGAFAAASTGTSISGLSGAAATSATLAWLGGGSIAAGGGGVAAGTIVLGSLVLAPAVLATAGLVSWQGRRQRRKQRQTATELDQAEREVTLAEQRTAVVLTRSRQIRAVLADLQEQTAARLPGLAELIGAHDDYATYTPGQRAQLAAVVGLVTTTIAVMATPMTDDTGALTDLSGQVLADAQQRLSDLAGDADGPAATHRPASPTRG
jgi:hypothetical protein